MVPWAGRVRHGRFTFDGIDHQLPINFAPHAIHGTGFEQAVGGHCPRRAERGARLPARLGVRRRGRADDRARRRLVDVHAGRACRRSGRCRRRSGGIRGSSSPSGSICSSSGCTCATTTTSPTGASSPRPRHRRGTTASPDLLATPRLWIGGIEVSITSDCEYWVVYDMPRHATCVEPQTALPDAFNLGGATASGPGRRAPPQHDISWA